MSVQASIPQRTDGRRYEAVLRLSEALSLCQEPEDLTKVLSEQLREFLDFLQFYIVVYKENSTEVEWAVVGREKSLVSAYADVPVQQRPSWQAYTTQEPFHIADLNTDERVPGRLTQNLAAQGIETGPLVFVPLTTPQRRLGALGMSGQPGISYSNDDISFLRLIGQVVAFAIDDNFNLKRAEAANAELQRQNERLQRSERELREVIETIPCMAWSASADGAAQFFNRRWLDYAGLAADQVQNWGWTAAVHPDDLNALVDYWRTAIASSQPGEIEARLRRFDGLYRWFLFRATPSFDDKGKVAKWYGTNTDIDDRKKAEQALIIQNNRLQLLLKLTNRITSKLDLREVLRAITATVRELTDSDAVHISLPEADSAPFRVYALDFPEGKGLIKEGMLIEPVGIARKALEELKPAVRTITHPEEFPSDYYKLLVAEGVKSQCVIPLVNRGRAVGVLAIARTRNNSFTPEEVDFMGEASGQIAIAIENSLAYRELCELKERLAQENLYLEQEIRRDVDFGQIVGSTPPLKQVLQLVETVAPTDSTVLLLGETGTGKELIARAVHEHSRRKDRIFVKVNCAAIPTGLLESELFGHERGAFTGAISQKIGRLELADGGTLFLDEVADIPSEIQPKLLRALQEQEFERLGSTRTLKVNVRLIAATNRDLVRMVAKGEFRSDLYYRLNVFPIRLPPLRERKEDIPLLVGYFVQKFAKQLQKDIKTIPPSVMKAFTNWEWPGNIRELENLVERSVILTRGKSLDAPLMEMRKLSGEERERETKDSRQEEIAEIVRSTIQALNGKPGLASDQGKKMADGRATKSAERAKKQREEIMRALTLSKGRVGGSDGAAARLGINRTTLLARIRKLGIDPGDYAALSGGPAEPCQNS
ncbi:MAG TPA: sigma 54-interacting transcriptional regulator [Candidatus Acidoferrales bacterium]|nr:sigma 54-interacting transcriptional regulator [Candidatus Acidoferrales bacterium]